MRRRGRERTRKRFCKKLPAEPFSGALPGVSVIELLVIESVFQYNPFTLRFPPMLLQQFPASTLPLPALLRLR